MNIPELDQIRPIIVEAGVEVEAGIKYEVESAGVASDLQKPGESKDDFLSRTCKYCKEYSVSAGKRLQLNIQCVSLTSPIVAILAQY